jgi:hypothetical protein
LRKYFSFANSLARQIFISLATNFTAGKRDERGDVYKFLFSSLPSNSKQRKRGGKAQKDAMENKKQLLFSRYDAL